jgi:phospholipase/carboxylesterase
VEDGAAEGRQWFSVRGVTEANRPARVRAAAAEVGPWIEAELARRHLAGDRLVLVGFSQGAIVAASLAIHRTPPPAAVVLMSGRVAEDDAPARRVGPPILIAHGAADAVLPFDLVAPGAATLTAWGADVTVRRYPGGHTVTRPELDDVAAFLAQHLGATR